MINNKAAMSEIIGNDTLKERLCRDIMSNSLSHAYIIEGPDGSGKKTIALMAAAALSCECRDDTSKPLPCLECPTCRKILENKCLDVVIKDAEGKASIGVDMARFLREDARVIPNDLEHKIYIIDQADMMTVQAQNALLLTLEEPPSFAHFFLLCNSAAPLLETIISRAPTLRTEVISDAQIDEYICKHDRQAAQLKLTSRAEYAQLIKSASGGIGRALELLDPKVWKPVKELRALVHELVVTAITRRSATQMLDLLPRLSTKRDKLNEELTTILIAIRDLILLKKSDDAPLKFFCDVNEAIDLCDRASLSFLFSFQEALLCAIEENKRNSNVKLLLTKMFISADLI